MMINAIEGCTRRIGKAQGYKGLPLRDEIMEGVPVMTSSWQPSPSELVELARGAPIYVTLQGSQHPPILVHIGPVPDDQVP